MPLPFWSLVALGSRMGQYPAASTSARAYRFVVASSLFRNPTNPTLALVSRITKPIPGVGFGTRNPTYGSKPDTRSAAVSDSRVGVGSETKTRHRVEAAIAFM